MCELLVKMKAAHRVGCPIVAIETADPTATIESLKELSPESPLFVWSLSNGYQPGNEAACADTSGISGAAVGNALEAVKKASGVPAESIVFMKMANHVFNVPIVVQGISDLRDAFKGNGRMLVMLGADMSGLPAELKHDVVLLEEQLPDSKQLGAIVDEVAESAREVHEGFAVNDKEKIVDTIRGLSAFEAEQTVAMAVKAEGIDVGECQSRKRKMIETTRGLSVFTGGNGFSDLAGLDQVKADMTGLVGGPLKPKAVVWIDEIGTSGLANQGDLSGVNSDQLGCILQTMTDDEVSGVFLLGVPGCGKSLMCKAMAREFDMIVIRLDLGEMQGSLVGQSQQNLRAALKVIRSIAGKNALYIATSNSLDGLSPALISRFPDIYFYPLPGREQKDACWEIHKRKMGLDEQANPRDEGFSGRNIDRCCRRAYSLGVPLSEACKSIIPEAVQNKDEIELLETQASGRYLNVEVPGPYRIDAGGNGRASKRRMVNK